MKYIIVPPLFVGAIFLFTRFCYWLMTKHPKIMLTALSVFVIAIVWIVIDLAVFSFS